ncbi:DUF4330 domain-containing protein [Halorussus gelatinilyticus]|uniref:DUF4330 domain-containing protein n=1 Tax=Halorussus gelatinilyticus TaxID=2937524 RepID=A0A8U0IKK9_9EURY|nr:DUF4330 domain-containing protein [Halorussus gelatinilyticus]UPW01298.1 DUF4330 domain-containing protein [Halorussus gelatinilyticus]
MPIIDDRGRLFGTVNIIDLFVVLMVLATVAAGATFVLDTNDKPVDTDRRTQTTVMYEIPGVQPYVADAIPEGSIQSDAIASIQSKSVRPTEVVVTGQNGTLHERTHPTKKTVTLRLTLNTTTTENDILFQNKPLEVGRQLTLDFGPVTTKGAITKITDES